MGERAGLAALLAAGLLASTAVAADEPMVLGAVFNTSGSQTVFDGPGRRGAELAVEAINGAGGVLGRPVALRPVGGDSTAGGVAEAVAAAIAADPSMPALFGLADTDLARAAGKVAVGDGRLFLSSGATAPQLPAVVGGPFFLAAFGDNVQAAAAAEWAARDLGAASAFVLFEPDVTYTALLKDYFVERFEAVGGATTVARLDPSAVPAVGTADLVFLAVQTAEDAVRAIRDLRAAGYDGPILGGDGYDAPAVWRDHPAIADVYFTTHVYLSPDNPDPKVGAFLKAYAASFPEATPTAFSALAYDAVGLIAAAATAAEDASPAAIAAGLADMFAYEGVTGTIRYEGGSHVPYKSVTILEVGDGRQSFVANHFPDRVPAP